ncbi:hypothetical protein DHEL01_v208371 [Diaporthe helianthi]|uniref:Uncharacterized protein n=1 Tax=Diaporthe helianthi TaxID=158607 RepID=A0A2P5HSL4_DIAHE|nr:hypothetical protein DHEL01_v208371 [Diaporthe helianthi]
MWDGFQHSAAHPESVSSLLLGAVVCGRPDAAAALANAPARGSHDRRASWEDAVQTSRHIDLVLPRQRPVGTHGQNRQQRDGVVGAVSDKDLPPNVC